VSLQFSRLLSLLCLLLAFGERLTEIRELAGVQRKGKYAPQEKGSPLEGRGPQSS
jgi:hypothetical protein